MPDFAEVESIVDQGELLALIVRSEFSKPGISFFTEPDFSQQLGFIKHPAGKQITPHVHKRVERTIVYTQETLFIRRGLLRVDFYSEAQQFLYSRTLRPGDVVLLIKGGHGFCVIEDVEMFEVKQGPYAGDGDKTLF